MAFFGEQQSNLKYFCKICKKGFGCGRALGGHMRAHGICDESGYIDNEDQESDWEYNIGGGGGNNNNNNDTAPINKRMYALRTNPNRQKSCKSCENCGMEFVSWKSFLEHGKCSSSKDIESLMSLSGSDFEDTTNGGRGTGWFKRKRSFRAKVDNLGLGLNSNNCPLSEEEDLANCLMMLSNATFELEESSASAREEEEWGIAAGPEPPMLGDNHKAIVVASSSSKRLFECKACKKVFNSHQALGGHRASHKKVKGCFAARLVHLDDEDETMHDEFFTSSSKSNSQLLKFDASLASPSKRKSKTHECSICHRIFSSGQALGGHKRCHWITSNLTETCTTTTDNTFHHQPHDLMEKISQRPTGIGKSEAFDLNFPVLHDEVVGIKRDPKHRLSFEAEVSTEIGLRPWMEPDDQKKNNDSSAAKVTAIAISNDNEGNNERASLRNPESEATSKVKLAKLSELDDINLNSGASFWLQVGLGSDKNVGVDV